MTNRVQADIANGEAPKVALLKGLNYHLGLNHYPPIHERWTPVCFEICQLYAERGDLDFDVNHPLRSGEQKSAMQVVEDMHLEPFLEILEGAAS